MSLGLDFFYFTINLIKTYNVVPYCLQSPYGYVIGMGQKGKIWIQKALHCCKTHFLMIVMTPKEVKNA